MDLLIENGKVYTVGVSKITGDRSYTGDLWKVLGQNENSIVVEHLGKSKNSRKSYWTDKPHILVRGEYDFCEADDLVPLVYTEGSSATEGEGR